MTIRRTFNFASLAVAATLALGLPTLAQAQAQAQTIKIAGLYELSGAGATRRHDVQERRRDGGERDQRSRRHPGQARSDHNIADTQTNPGVAKGLATKAIDDGAFAVFGPVFSGSIMVSMAETRRAEIPNFTGGEAAAITKQGNPYIFRTSFTQATAMPKVARYIANNLKAKNRGGDLRQQRLRQGRPRRDHQGAWATRA